MRVAAGNPLDRARARLAAPVGAPGSGWLRYGAAMALWQAGEIAPEALEVYRICATLDDEDPGAVLAERGLEAPRLAAPVPQAVRLGRLVEEVDRVLAGATGPGIAEVRQGLSRAVPQTAVPGGRNPVVAAHLPAALAAVAEAEAGLAEAIAAAAGDLAWLSYDAYAPGTLDAGFLQGHAYASLVGEGAPYQAGDFDLGLFLIAPQLFYRDHCHAAPELYLPFTGPHLWRFAPDTPLVEKPAFEPVWNEPFAPHATKVGAVPFLCLYAWTRDAQAVAEVVPATDWDEIAAMRVE